MFDNIALDDIIMAFFPCTMFQENNALLFRGVANQFQSVSDEYKLRYVHERHKTLHEMYERFTELCMVAIARGLKLIIENPYTQPHYLTRYFPIEPALIDMDRTIRGDKFKKPTQYWFINCKLQNNFIFEPQEIIDTEIIERLTGGNRQARRSEITPEYARRFIREFVIAQNL